MFLSLGSLVLLCARCPFGHLADDSDSASWGTGVESLTLGLCTQHRLLIRCRTTSYESLVTACQPQHMVFERPTCPGEQSTPSTYPCLQPLLSTRISCVRQHEIWLVARGGAQRPMDVFELRERLVRDYQSYISSFIQIRDSRITETVNEALSGGLLWPDPLIQLNPAFEPGKWIERSVPNLQVCLDMDNALRDVRR